MKFFSFWRSLASFRVRVAIALKKIDVDTVPINILVGEQHSGEYRKINPQMLIPAVDDGEPPILFQSLAIIEYLDETYPEPPLLPHTPRGRAWVRGLSQIVSSDAHPLIVPRVRAFLEREIGLDKESRLKFIRHWFVEGYKALEAHLSADGQTGRYCYGDSVTLADICLVSHSIGGQFFGCGTKDYPNVARISAACLELDAFERALPLNQPGAPSSLPK